MGVAVSRLVVLLHYGMEVKHDRLKTCLVFGVGHGENEGS